jgi:hypothetical protein
LFFSRQTVNEDTQVILCFLITETRGFLLMKTGLEAVASSYCSSAHLQSACMVLQGLHGAKQADMN